MTNAEDDPSFEPEELETLDGELLPEREALSVIRSSADTLADAAAAPIPDPTRAARTEGAIRGPARAGPRAARGAASSHSLSRTPATLTSSPTRTPRRLSRLPDSDSTVSIARATCKEGVAYREATP
jgi:hypothetical protein